MATVHADFQERKRIVFEARGRAQVNVRTSGEDGLIGYSSTELLLISLGNCMLGTLMGHELLENAAVNRVHATLESEMADEPRRVAKIDVVIDLDVADPSLLAQHATLLAASCGCPMCNTIGPTARISVDLRMTCNGQAAGK